MPPPWQEPPSITLQPRQHPSSPSAAPWAVQDQKEAAWLLPAVHKCHSARQMLCTLALAKSQPGLPTASGATWLLLVASGEASSSPTPSAAAGAGELPHRPYVAQILSYFLSLVLHGHYPGEGQAWPGVCIGY